MARLFHSKEQGYKTKQKMAEKEKNWLLVNCCTGFSSGKMPLLTTCFL